MNKLHNLTGEDPDQLLILTDKNGSQKGFASRRDCHKGEGRPHLAFLAFITDKDKNLILAKRAKTKSLWPLLWDASVVSHVLPGESPAKAANRRGREEMGVDIDFKDTGAFYYFNKFNGASENEYCHVLIGSTAKDVDYNPVEIETIRKISYPDLIKEIRKSPDTFTPWLKISLEKLNSQIYFA